VHALALLLFLFPFLFCAGYAMRRSKIEASDDDDDDDDDDDERRDDTL